MNTEKRLASYVAQTKYEELPRETVHFVRNLTLGVLGTTIAGAAEQDCRRMRELVKGWGGKPEATIMTSSDKVPAHAAAFVNSIMARALDYEDGLPPGVHFSASIVPTAFAAAELAGGCAGKEFLTAVTLGSEVAAKLNSCSFYDGFDPTGIVSGIGATAAAGRIMGLDAGQMLDALALAFNKAGGSFQCNIDGVLAVRAIQGFVSQGAIICVQLAQQAITGPPNFIEGVYGYLHLYGRDRFKSDDVLRVLGTSFDLHETLVKKYPSCGCTLSATEAALDLVKEHQFLPEEVARVDIRLTPYCCNLVGHPFKIGASPRVDAQFNVQYCVANAILRRGSGLSHFEEPAIRDPKISRLVESIVVTPDPDLQEPGSERSLASHVKVTMKTGVIHEKMVKQAKGMPGNPMSQQEYVEHFMDCVDYAPKRLQEKNAARIVSTIERLEEVADVCELIPLLSAG